MKSKDTILIGDKIFLRPPKKGELKYIQSLWEDPDTMKEVGGVYPYSDYEIEKWYNNIVDPGSNNHFYCLIFVKETELPVGEISFHQFDYSIYNSANFNVKVQYRHRKNGYFSEAVNLFLKHYFVTLKREELVDDIGLENTVSHQIFLNLGFEHLVERKDVFFVRMTRDQYTKRHNL